MNFVEYCKIFKSEDWKVMVTDKWNVRDVVTHMLVWEKQGVKYLKNFIARSESEPLKDWDKVKYDSYNEESLKSYKDHTPKQLIEEWETFQVEVGKLIAQVGESELRQHKGMRWILGKEDGTESSHYDNHHQKIRDALGH